MSKYIRIITLSAALMFLLLIPLMSWGAMTGLEAHEKYIYPIVRITIPQAGSGSGTIIYSEYEAIGGKIPKASTYVLTNYHVIDAAITIEEKWDSDLQKQVKKEKRAIVYVEIFRYRDISTPIGTLRVEADVVLYDEDQDIALIKLRTEKPAKYTAKLSYPAPNVTVMDETVAVGCSLGFPPLPTVGNITRKNQQVNSLPYHMSSSQIIYGNSGGAMFLAETGELIGIPSLVAVVGWAGAVTHMGLFIPIDRIYQWLENEHYDFIYDTTLTESICLEIREKEIKAKKNK